MNGDEFVNERVLAGRYELEVPLGRVDSPLQGLIARGMAKNPRPCCRCCCATAIGCLGPVLRVDLGGRRPQAQARDRCDGRGVHVRAAVLTATATPTPAPTNTIVIE